MLCLLCERELRPREDGLYDHVVALDCLVTLCDAYGVSIDAPESSEVDAFDAASKLPDDDGVIDLDPYPHVDEVLLDIFREHGLERLGGASTGRGWSSFNLFQKCPYAWKRRYIEAARPVIVVESPAIAIGSLVHAFLAVMYMCKIVDGYPLSPEMLCDYARMQARPAYVEEAWRVFTAYRLFYMYDDFVPLAVEYDLRDPRTGESCRYDLVAYFPNSAPMRLPGTYVIEHKTAQRFDLATTDGWANDGEVLGQITLWKRLGLDKRFGELQGVIVNICGKQKEPQFHRTIVAPLSFQIAQHTEDLKRWEGAIQLSRATDNFPRARHSCVGRHGMCEWFDHCATGA